MNADMIDIEIELPHGSLLTYDTGDFIRAATAQESEGSGPFGELIVVDGRRCYVD